MTVKEELKQAVEALSDSEAQLWLEALTTRNPLLMTLLLAPEDDEEETDEERALVEEARAEVEQGHVVPWAEVRARWHEDGA